MGCFHGNKWSSTDLGLSQTDEHLINRAETGQTSTGRALPGHTGAKQHTAPVLHYTLAVQNTHEAYMLVMIVHVHVNY